MSPASRSARPSWLGALPVRSLANAQKEPERVPIGSHGVRADAALGDEEGFGDTPRSPRENSRLDEPVREGLFPNESTELGIPSTVVPGTKAPTICTKTRACLSVLCCLGLPSTATVSPWAMGDWVVVFQFLSATRQPVSRSDSFPLGLDLPSAFPRPAVHSALDLVKLGPVVSCEVGPFLPTTSMRTGFASKRRCRYAELALVGQHHGAGAAGKTLSANASTWGAAGLASQAQGKSARHNPGTVRR